jgi:hypothetical protein
MTQKEKLACLFDKLNESDQKAAYEYMLSLVRRNKESMEGEQISKIYGKHFYVVSD